MYTVSFGRKIPFAQIQVKDKHKNKYVPATIYEMDCTSPDDMVEVLRAKGSWTYKDSIVRNMNTKYSLQKFHIFAFRDNYGENSILGEHSSYNNNLLMNRFYITQLDNSSIIGMSQVHNKNGSLHIDFIESKKNEKYKYVGQTLLAALGLDLLKEDGKQMVVDDPVESALPFYIKKCKFQQSIAGSLTMDIKQIKKLIKKTQKKTKAPIINLNI